MDEIRRDYYDQLHEQNLTRHVGTTSKPRLPTERELKAQAHPVKIVVYPALQTLPERIKYLQGKETVVDFCCRAEISMKAYFRIINGDSTITDSRFFKRVAQNLHCPEDWLKNGKSMNKETAEADTAGQLPAFVTLGERLKWLRDSKSINSFCAATGISSSTYYRCMKPDYGLAADIANTIARNANVPLAWLVGDTVLKATPSKKRGKIRMAKEQISGIVLNLCGAYTGKQLSMILAGLGEHTFEVQLNLKEKNRSYECGEEESL